MKITIVNEIAPMFAFDFDEEKRPTSARNKKGWQGKMLSGQEAAGLRGFGGNADVLKQYEPLFYISKRGDGGRFMATNDPKGWPEPHPYVVTSKNTVIATEDLPEGAADKLRELGWKG